MYRIKDCVPPEDSMAGMSANNSRSEMRRRGEYIECLEARITELEYQLKGMVELWDDAECLPKCDSIAHEELCPVVNPAGAIRAQVLADVLALPRKVGNMIFAPDIEALREEGGDGRCS